MADLREITVDWVTASGGGKKSVMFFLASAATINEQREAVWGFLDIADLYLDNGVTYSVATEGRTVDSSSGTLTAMWSDTENFAGGGAASGESVADATQVLVKWQTNSIFSGRMLRGRTFLPGLSAGQLVSGNLSATAQGNINTACSTFIGYDRGFVIWHRPISGSGGGYAEASAGTAWNELAVLRRRRG